MNTEKENQLPDNQYIPGVCNIGKAEIQRRQKAIYTALGMIIFYVVVLHYFHTAKIWRLIIFLPVISFAVGVLQVYFKFCVGFGLKGVFNFGDLGSTFTVEQQEYYKKDRNKAIQIIVISFVFAVLVSVLYYLL